MLFLEPEQFKGQHYAPNVMQMEAKLQFLAKFSQGGVAGAAEDCPDLTRWG
jgi:hypothetical protein